MQRFWLTAAKLGLQIQPELTPLIFAGYARAGRRLSEVAAAGPQALHLMRKLEELVGPRDACHAVFMGRVGQGMIAEARSLRRPLNRLQRDANA